MGKVSSSRIRSTKKPKIWDLPYRRTYNRVWEDSSSDDDEKVASPDKKMAPFVDVHQIRKDPPRLPFFKESPARKWQAMFKTPTPTPADASRTASAATNWRLMDTPQKTNGIDREVQDKKAARELHRQEALRRVQWQMANPGEELPESLRNKKIDAYKARAIAALRSNGKKPISNSNASQEEEPKVGTQIKTPSLCKMQLSPKEVITPQPIVQPPTINFAALVANVPLSGDIQVAVIPPSICKAPKNETIQEKEPLADTHIGTHHCLKLSSLSAGFQQANCEQLKDKVLVMNTPKINFALLGGETIKSEMIKHEHSKVDTLIDTPKSATFSGGVSKFVCEEPKEIPVSTLPKINFSLLGEPIKSVEKVASSPIASITKTDIPAPIKSQEPTISLPTTTIESVKKRPMMKVDEPSPHLEFAFKCTPNLSKAWNSFGDGLNVKLLGDKESVLRVEKTEFESFGKRRKVAVEEPNLLQVELKVEAKPAVASSSDSICDGEKVAVPSFNYIAVLPDSQMAVPVAQHQIVEVPPVFPVVPDAFFSSPIPTMNETIDFKSERNDE